MHHETEIIVKIKEQTISTAGERAIRQAIEEYNRDNGTDLPTETPRDLRNGAQEIMGKLLFGILASWIRNEGNRAANEVELIRRYSIASDCERQAVLKQLPEIPH